MTKPFAGFERPEQNWSKLPHTFIESLPYVRTIGEMKVVLYILRHTWGFQEFHESKKITTEEFQNGRKLRDGTRMDGGTGLTSPTIREGLKQAVLHGFIEVEVDDSDLARVKKYYSIRMVQEQVVKVLPPDSKSFTTGGKESLHRSEKDTPERNLEKDGETPLSDSPTVPAPEPDAFDTLFPEDPDSPPTLEAPFSGRDLQTEDGRRLAQEHLTAQRAATQEVRAQLTVEQICPTLRRYNPGVGVLRSAVVGFIQTMVDAGIPLDYQNKPEVRFWISETESLLRKAQGDEAILGAALAQIQRDELTIKSPKSIGYAVSTIMQERHQQKSGYGEFSGSSGGVITRLRPVNPIQYESED